MGKSTSCDEYSKAVIVQMHKDRTWYGGIPKAENISKRF